jgi:hypothetical protein
VVQTTKRKRREDEYIKIHNEEVTSMNEKKFSLLPLAVILFVVVGVANIAQALELGVRGYYWFPAFSATQRVDTTSMKGPEFDVKNTLVVSNQSFRSGEIYGGVGKHHLIANILEARAQVTGMGYSGNSVIEALADISATPFPFVDIHSGYKYIS